MDYRPEDEVQPPYHILAGTFTMYVIRVCYEHFWHTGKTPPSRCPSQEDAYTNVVVIGDLEYIRILYPKLQKLMSLIQQKIDKRNVLYMTGKWAMDSDYYNKPRTGATTKNNALYIISLGKLADIAGYLGDGEAQTRYLEDAQKTKAATNALLFNERTGLYDASENDRDIISQDANAFALLAGLPSTPAQRSSILTHLRQLYTPGGCVSFNVDSGYMETPVVSPIMNGWHAEAALQTPGHFADALQIWRSCWGPMIDRDSEFYTGAHWEFSTPEGTPHMEHFCSLAHPFSSLPVYQLGKYGLGLFPTQPGWKTFAMQVLWGFLEQLTYAKGRVPTPAGTITASWVKEANGIYTVELLAPVGIEGTLKLPFSPEGKRPAYEGADELSDGGIRCAGGTKVKVTIRY
jgi:alpha-L-rhamnosidase